MRPPKRCIRRGELARARIVLPLLNEARRAEYRELLSQYEDSQIPLRASPTGWGGAEAERPAVYWAHLQPTVVAQAQEEDEVADGHQSEDEDEVADEHGDE